MLLNGKQIGLAYTVQAYEEIRKQCKDEDIANINALVTGSQAVAGILAVLVAMNRAYEDRKGYLLAKKGIDYTPSYIDTAELQYLDFDEITENIAPTLLAVMSGEGKMEIDAEAPQASQKK